LAQNIISELAFDDPIEILEMFGLFSIGKNVFVKTFSEFGILKSLRREMRKNHTVYPEIATEIIENQQEIDKAGLKISEQIKADLKSISEYVSDDLCSYAEENKPAINMIVAKLFPLILSTEPSSKFTLLLSDALEE